MERAKGFEPSTQSLESTQPQAVPQTPKDWYTQIRAQISGPIDPDLARVLEAWPALSPPIKAAVLSVVAAGKAQREGQP